MSHDAMPKWKLTILTLADLPAVLAVSLPRTRLVAPFPSPPRWTRAGTSHGVTRGAVMTRTRVPSINICIVLLKIFSSLPACGPPSARGTGHGARAAPVPVVALTRVRGHTRAVLAARPGNIFNWIKIYYSDPKLNHESAELPSHKFKTPHRAANIITLQM